MRWPRLIFGGLHVLAPLLLTGVHLGPAYGQVHTSVTEPLEWSRVAANEQGVLQSLLVREGERVIRGQPLAWLDRRELESAKRLAELKAASQAAVAVAQADLELKRRQRDNLLQVQQSGHANPFEVDQALAMYSKAEAQLQLAQEEIAQQHLEVERLQALIERRGVHSPIDGWVVELHRRPGEFVSSSEPHVATLVRLDRLRVRFYLQPGTVEHLQVGSEVAIEVAPDWRLIQAKIDFISPIIEAKSGLIRLDVLIDNEPLQLRSGVLCRWIDARSHIGRSAAVGTPIRLPPLPVGHELAPRREGWPSGTVQWSEPNPGQTLPRAPRVGTDQQFVGGNHR
jgi:RND family efflux transporter MFP subunit